MIVYRWLTPTATIPCLKVEQEAIDLLTTAAEQGVALLVEPLVLAFQAASAASPCQGLGADAQKAAPAPASSQQGGQLLDYILSHDDLAPVLLNSLHSWPSLTML